MQNRKNSELFEYIIQTGMTKAQIIFRLNEMIDAESLKPEGQRDAEFISACLELQYFLTTGEKYHSSKEVAKKKLVQAVHKQQKYRNKARPAMLSIGVATCIACVFLVLPILGQTLLERSWIEGRSVNGGEVYRLNGNEIDPNILKAVIAENKTADISIQTSDFEMICRLKDTGALHPHYIPDGWKEYEFSYEIIDGIVFYKERYKNPSKDKELVFRCKLFPDYESFDIGIEQDESGNYVTVEGITVYFTDNIDTLVATWHDGLKCYSLYGPIKQIEMEDIIESIGEEDL